MQDSTVQKTTKRTVLKKAFISSLPVMMGYISMGIAAGVLLSAKSGLKHPALYGFLSSLTSISGTLQFMLVDWIRNEIPLLSIAMLTVCLNIRYGIYGISLLEPLRHTEKIKKWYLIWTLTDETYALETESKEKNPKAWLLYCMSLAFFDHMYWVIGVTSGAIAGTALPFSNKGIDFSMTALFLVILTDQFSEKNNRISACIGALSALPPLLIFGAGDMLLPAMILMIIVFMVFRKKIERVLDGGTTA